MAREIQKLRKLTMYIGEEISKSELHDLLDREEFAEGPFVIEDAPVVGGGYRNVPYTESHRAGGLLKDGRRVWAWTSGSKVRKESPVACLSCSRTFFPKSQGGGVAQHCNSCNPWKNSPVVVEG